GERRGPGRWSATPRGSGPSPAELRQPSAPQLHARKVGVAGGAWDGERGRRAARPHAGLSATDHSLQILRIAFALHGDPRGGVFDLAKVARGGRPAGGP